MGNSKSNSQTFFQKYEDKRHIKSFNEASENLNIYDVRSSDFERYYKWIGDKNADSPYQYVKMAICIILIMAVAFGMWYWL